MKAIRVHAFGGNNAMVYEDVPDPTAGEGEYVVRVRAAGVNPVDWKIVRGYLSKGYPHALPFVPGWDLAGEVIARGHGARRFEVGQRVYGYARRPTIDRGTYAEQQAVPECYLAAMPTRASFVKDPLRTIEHLTRPGRALALTPAPCQNALLFRL